MKRALESCAAPTQQPDRDRDLPDVLTQKDICELLGISDESWRRWRAAGRTPDQADLPGRPRWRRVDFEAWLRRPRTRQASRHFQSVYRRRA